MDLISIAGIIISFAIAFWQYSRAQKAEFELKKGLNEIPSKVTHQLKNVLSHLPVNSKESQNSETTSQFYMVQLADVNNDGSDELIVQLPAGAHGSLVKVFARNAEDLVEIDQLGWGTPAQCQITDIDDDGKLEIVGRETDWDTDLPYYVAPQMQVIYKWNGSEFVLAGTLKDYTSEDIANIRKNLKNKRI